MSLDHREWRWVPMKWVTESRGAGLLDKGKGKGKAIAQPFFHPRPTAKGKGKGK